MALRVDTSRPAKLTVKGAAVWGAVAAALIIMTVCSRVATGCRRMMEGAAYLGMFA